MLKDKITFSFFDDTRRLARIHFNFENKTLSLFDTKDFIYIYTVLQMFLQGRLEKEEKTFELTMLNGIMDGDQKIELNFLHFADFNFEKRSENNKQYLIIKVTRRYVIAKEEDQDWEEDDRDENLKKYKEYMDKEIELVKPAEPIRLTRFQAQYYLNILQKVSYSW